MALVASGTQYSSAPINYSPAPFTFAAWFRRIGNIYSNEDSLIGAGQSGADTTFVNMQIFFEENTRAISFVPFANSNRSPAPTADSAFHFFLAEFNGTNLSIQVDGNVSTPTSYTPDSVTLNILTLMRTPQQSIAGQCHGAIEHAAAWRGTLTSGEKAALLNQTTNPADIQTANRIFYRPLVNSLSDVDSHLTWTDVGLLSPTYESSGITYPAPAGSTATVIYNGNSNSSGTTPTDTSSPYAIGATVTTLTNSGTLARTGYTFNGWNTAANGTGTHYATGVTFTISANTTLYAEWSAVTTRTVTYNGNSNTGGTTPTDGSSPYSDNATVTVLGNTGSLVRTGHTFNGWNTAANGTGTARAPASTFTITANVTLYAQWTQDAPAGTGMTIDHTNYNPSSRSNAEIAAAAALDVFLAHASVGGYIVGPTGTWPYNGLAALQAEDSRYTTPRATWETPTAPVTSWFASNNGLGDYYYGNDGYVAKITDFRSRLAASTRALANAVDVAMMKFCYIDAPDASDWNNGYSAATMFAAYRDAMLAEMALSPSVVYVWWTMPLEITGSAGRQAFNDLVRAYCAEHDYWLFDIADIECHTDAGVKQLDGTNELLYSGYANDAWGHPNAAGALKLARAYWSLLAYIANGAPTYTISDVTRDRDGEVIGSVRVSLFSNSGNGVFAYVGTTVSDAATGAFSFTVANGTTQHFCYYHLPGTPNRYDASDNNLVGVSS